MTFTEQDAENDGKIKREAGTEMAKQAKTHNPEMYEYFEDVCAEIGREPANVLGEMAVKALESEAYANQLLQAEISMADLRANEIRMEDVEFVTSLADKLGLNDTTQQKDPIEELVESRVESVASTPLSNFNKNKDKGGEVSEDVANHLQSLHAKIERLEGKVDSEAREAPSGDQQTDDSQGVGDLFDEGEEGGEEAKDVRVVQEEDVSEDPEPEEEEGEDEAEEEPEILDADIAINEEEDEDDGEAQPDDQPPSFSSVDAIVEGDE